VSPTLAEIKAIPKVLLHDHLDGGVRPQTLLELADLVGYSELPAHAAAALQEHFDKQAAAGSLELYLTSFGHIQPLLQSANALQRVARECVADLGADNVAYAEVRFAPQAHTLGGLTLDDAVEAVLDGLDSANVHLIITALRHEPDSIEVAELARRWADNGVVGFDLAGPEHGFPCSLHAEALAMVRGHVPITIHAGEGDGPHSILEALDHGAQRIGHGVRLADCLATGWRGPAVIDRVLRDNVTLEICPTSNVQTGVVANLAAHPTQQLRDRGVRVTINTDNRTFGVHTLGAELRQMAEMFGWNNEDLSALTECARSAVFGDSGLL
jgi:adenosine deaminase